MAKATSRVQKVLKKADPMKSKTGKLNLTALSVKALEDLKKITKPKNMAKVNAELEKRALSVKEVVVPLVYPSANKTVWIVDEPFITP